MCRADLNRLTIGKMSMQKSDMWSFCRAECKTRQCHPLAAVASAQEHIIPEQGHFPVGIGLCLIAVMSVNVHVNSGVCELNVCSLLILVRSFDSKRQHPPVRLLIVIQHMSCEHHESKVHILYLLDIVI
jgi:hypothetical protein